MNTHHAALRPKVRLARLIKKLGQSVADVATCKRPSKPGAIRRKKGEQEHRENGKQSAKLLRESQQLQERLRDLIHRILSAQEAERKTVSTDLHDEVVQTLLGINVRLVALKMVALGDNANLKKEIANTQKLVQESLRSVNRFARELNIHPRI